ncbi:DNA polymerase epsilon subunit 2-like [Octopus sinensis]|uniref:DNA polymerase epsilon subunit n=1 Tax=Octopus sinensis TaxID=2607531 RepID=A0A6P7TLN2_9MOLL|nr:DNA polymerase epsilon subunit 2-like [Octopus sinensis]
MASKLKVELMNTFKMHGLTLRGEASKFLLEHLETMKASKRMQMIDKILENIMKQPLTSSLIDRFTCMTALQECVAGDEHDGENAFSVIDAFSVPRYTYADERKKFILNQELGLSPPLLHGQPADLGKLFKDRYMLLYQRTMRHHLFTPPAIGNMDENSQKFQLKPIEHLLGTTSKVGELIVLGMLTQLKEGKWYLEDPSGSVLIDLTGASFHTGLFTENCFVLAEGWYEDSIFHVTAFGFPPPEPASVTRSYFGNINFFGGPLKTCAKASDKLRHLEVENQESMFVFLSDVWLDEPKVVDKLKVLFSGYSEHPPVAFVFCGNFTSLCHQANHTKILRESFIELCDIICKYQNLKDCCRFIFVPGPLDPGPTNILPRPAIPNSITEYFRKKIPHAIFTSNPCRIQYCTQEIVVFREDIVTKLCRSCIRFPTSGDVPTHFAKTIVSQGHLCPLPLHVCPVYWAYDCGLQLYPLPDLLVCAGKYDGFTVNSLDCIITNPGSFSRSNFSFKVYIPSTKQMENSKIE